MNSKKVQPTPHVRADGIKLSTGAGLALAVAGWWLRYLTATTARDKRDNATFLHAADTDKTGRPARARHLTQAKWRRVARRNVFVGIPAAWALVTYAVVPAGHVFGLTSGFFALPWLLIGQAYALALVLAGAVLASWFVVSYRAWLLIPRVQVRQFGRVRLPVLARPMLTEFIRPSAEVLCDAVGVPYIPSQATRMVHVERGFAPAVDDTKGVVLTLPNRVIAEGKTPEVGQRAKIAKAVGARHGMTNPRAEWTETGRYLRVRLLPAVVIAETADVESFLSLASRSLPTSPVLGFGQGGKAVRLTDRKNAPHTANTADTGRGKSTLYRALLPQYLRHGEAVLVIDAVKRGQSHRWIHGLPRVRVARDVEQAHDALVGVRKLMDGRYEEMNNGARAEDFIPVHVVMEEANATAPELQTYWEVLRSQDKTLPTKSPAVYAMRTLVFAGREVGIFVHYIGQRLSADVFGARGGDVRENFPNALMAGWKLPTWKMWAAGHPYQAYPRTQTVGLWAQVHSAGVEWFRVPNVSDGQARDLALSGGAVDDFWPEEFSALTSGRASSARVIDGETTQEVPFIPARMTLRELSAHLESLGSPLSVDTLKQYAAPNGARRNDALLAAQIRGERRSGAQLYDVSAALKALNVSVSDDPFGRELPETSTRGWGMVYGLFVDGVAQVAYVGKSRRPRGVRTDEHREDKAWGDRIIGEVVLWEGECTDEELHAREMRTIAEVKPLYNWEGQEGAAHYVPYAETLKERHARDDAAGRERWIDPNPNRGLGLAA